MFRAFAIWSGLKIFLARVIFVFFNWHLHFRRIGWRCAKLAKNHAEQAQRFYSDFFASNLAAKNLARE